MRGKRGRPRKYRHDVRCPECGSNWCVKNGHQKNGKQKFMCKDCGRSFIWKGEKNKHPEKVKEQALRMLGEGMSISAVSRVLGIPEGTVSCWLYREGKKLIEENEMKLEKLRKEKGFKEVKSISLDEMWTYVGARRGAKRNSYWVWTAVIEVENGEEVVTFEVGKRDEETFLKAMGENTFC